MRRKKSNHRYYARADTSHIYRASNTSGVRRARSGTARRGRRISSTMIALIITLLAVTTSTFMYLTAQTTPVTNAFLMGQADINIVEPGVDPSDVSWGADTKPVMLQNPEGDDSVPGVVRAMIVPLLADKTTGIPTGGSLGTIESPSGSTIVLGDFTLHFAGDWSSNWFYRDGYFYYKNVLKPGETTEQLLAGVTLTDSSKASDYENITVKIQVLADILQANGDAPAEWGLTVDAGGNVS